MFGRRRRNNEPDENEITEPTAAEADAEITDDEPADEAAGSDDAVVGPFDANDDDIPERERVDFGGFRVPLDEELEIQANFEATEVDEEGNPVDGRLAMVTVMHSESGLQLQAFAAPKTDGLWADVRRETVGEIEELGGDTREADGPFGPELHAMVPVEIPEEIKDQVPPEVLEQGFVFQPIRFIGVDGPRWFLRGVMQGAAAASVMGDDQDEAETTPEEAEAKRNASEQAAKLEEIFAGVVVVRGDSPMPPKEPLELSLPAEAEQALAEQDEEDEPTLNPFERGPEITEVR